LEATNSFGEYLRRRRKKLDLTREALAAMVGCSASTLRKIESNERRPSKQLAELIAASLQIPPEEQKLFIRIARGQLLDDRYQITAPQLDISLPGRKVIAPNVHVPIPATPLVGRKSEITALSHLLNNPQSRLITLIGLGGIGKTRLAIEVAKNQTDFFTDGVYFISLSRIIQAEHIISTIADEMNFSFYGPIDPKTQLLNFLQ
jgi:transcriptional regulator with XRE-family HTH domain